METYEKYEYHNDIPDSQHDYVDIGVDRCRDLCSAFFGCHKFTFYTNQRSHLEG